MVAARVGGNSTATVLRDRWIGWSGLAFVALFLTGFMIWTTPDSDASVREWTEHFDDSGNRATIIVGVFLVAASGLAFLAFVTGLRDRLRRLGASQTLAGTAFVAGVAFMVCTLVASAAWSAVATAVEFGDAPVANGEIARAFEHLGFTVLLIPGAFALALFVVTTSAAARRTGALPRWIATAGYVAGPAALAGAVFLPMALPFLWLLAVSIVLAVGYASDGEAAPTTVSAETTLEAANA